MSRVHLLALPYSILAAVVFAASVAIIALRIGEDP